MRFFLLSLLLAPVALAATSPTSRSSTTSRSSSSSSSRVTSSPTSKPVLKASPTTTSKTVTTYPALKGCNRDNCLRQLIQSVTSAGGFCNTFTLTVNAAPTGLPSYVKQCSSSAARISSACSCLAGIASLSTMAPLPTTTPTSVYTAPPVPSSYESCLVDPTAADLTFRMLDPNTGIPVINNGGLAQKASDILDSIPEFNFQKTSTPGIYDLKLGNMFLAADLTGKAIFVPASTGQQYATANGNSWITSLFSYGCDGVLSIGIPGVVPFEFGYLDGDNQLYLQPILSQYNPPAKASLKLARHELAKRIIDDATRLKIALSQYRANLQRAAPVVAPSPTYRVNDVTADRCPNVPTGLQAFTRADARPVQVNGCGSTGISTLVPNLIFKECCDNHDVCYDTCSQQWGPCNNDFKQCNNNKCNAKYPDSAFMRWSCGNVADFYAWSVSGTSGTKAFFGSTKDRCECHCGDGQTVCNNKCMDVTSDPNNCGSCGNTCPSGQCIQGQCYVEPTIVLPPASKDECDPANFYYFTDSSLLAAPYRVRDFRALGSVGTPFTMDMKIECCRKCHERSDCLGYLLFPGGARFIGPGCFTYYQTADDRPANFQPSKDTCPLGGMDQWFSGLGQGQLGQEVEPGPCVRDFGNSINT